MTASDLLAYIAAVAANPAYTARFQSDLVQPGLRIPLTGRADLYREAVDLGQRVIWLHTYGDRFADPAAGRPAGPPRAPGGPTIPAGGTIPSDPAKFPNDLRYDATAQRLYVGEGFIDNVPQAVRDYEVSGRNVIDQWFSYRRKDRSRPIIGDRRPPSPLDSVQPERWPSSYTEDLLNLLHVLRLLTELEPVQADLLERICTGPLIDAGLLRAEGVFDDISAAVTRRVSPNAPVKSISNETTFGEDTSDPDLLDGHLWRLSEKVADRAKAKGLAGRVVTLKLKRADHGLVTRRQALREATQLTDTLYRAARGLMEHVPQGRAWRLIGVGLSELGPEAGADRSGDLLDPQAAKRAGAERASDLIRARFGPDAILKGRSLR